MRRHLLGLSSGGKTAMRGIMILEVENLGSSKSSPLGSDMPVRIESWPPRSQIRYTLIFRNSIAALVFSAELLSLVNHDIFHGSCSHGYSETYILATRWFVVAALVQHSIYNEIDQYLRSLTFCFQFCNCAGGSPAADHRLPWMLRQLHAPYPILLFPFWHTKILCLAQAISKSGCTPPDNYSCVYTTAGLNTTSVEFFKCTNEGNPCDTEKSSRSSLQISVSCTNN